MFLCLYSSKRTIVTQFSIRYITSCIAIVERPVSFADLDSLLKTSLSDDESYLKSFLTQNTTLKFERRAFLDNRDFNLINKYCALAINVGVVSLRGNHMKR